MKMRRCNTRDPTLLRAIAEEGGGIDCASGLVLCLCLCLSRYGVFLGWSGRQRHRQAAGPAAWDLLWREIEEKSNQGGVEDGRIICVEHRKFATLIGLPAPSLLHGTALHCTATS